MELKNIVEKVQEKLRELMEGSKEKTPKEILVEEVIKPTESEELSEKEQAEKLINALKENPDIQEPLVKAAVESPKISQKVIDESAQRAAGSPEVPDNVTGTLVEQASDDATVDILQNEGISSDLVRMEAINSLEDDEKKEDAICKEIEELYEGLIDFQSQKDIIQRLKYCLDKVEMERTSKINEELYKTISKAFAIQYHEFNGSIKIFPMEEIIPIDEMIRVKIPQRIEKEYQDMKMVKAKPKEKRNQKIFQYNGKIEPFNLEIIIQFFLNRMARKVVGDAKKENRNASVFMKNLGQLTDEEEFYLKDEFIKLGIEEKDLEIILRIAKGEIEESQEDILGSEIDQGNTEKLQENARYENIQKSKLVGNDLSALATEEIEAIRDCIESGFIENLGKLPSDMRKKFLETINCSLGQRTSKIVQKAEKSEIAKIEDTPKVKKAEWGDDPR